jgi:hypothetical protein
MGGSAESFPSGRSAGFGCPAQLGTKRCHESENNTQASGYRCRGRQKVACGETTRALHSNDYSGHHTMRSSSVSMALPSGAVTVAGRGDLTGTFALSSGMSYSCVR